jgi:flagellar motility protein MotE (MotC chaperone)
VEQLAKKEEEALMREKDFADVAERNKDLQKKLRKLRRKLDVRFCNSEFFQSCACAYAHFVITGQKRWCK